MNLNQMDVDLIKGALDTLGTKLADYNHEWTDGEREIYERAIHILEGE